MLRIFLLARTGAMLVALCWAFPMRTAYAVVMYQWIDENGRTQVSDTVPDKYRKTARQIDSRRYEVSEEERRAAAAEAARLVQNAGSIGRPARTEVSAPAPSTSTPTTVKPRKGRPYLSVAVPDGAPPECAALFRAFFESQLCFDRATRNVGGAVNKAKALHCADVPDPSPRCGVPVLSSHRGPQLPTAPQPLYPPGDADRWSTRH